MRGRPPARSRPGSPVAGLPGQSVCVARVNPRARAAASVAPLRETPGIRATACARPSASPSPGRGVLARDRRARRASASAIATPPAIRPAAIERGPPSRRSIAAAARARRSRAAPATARSSPRAPRRVQLPALPEQLPAHVDRQRDARAGVQRDLEGLAQLGVELRVAPAEQPGDQRRVRRGGDRQQLCRALQQARARPRGRSGEGASLRAAVEHRRRVLQPASAAGSRVAADGGG